MYFNQLCNTILENLQESIHEKEERYLTWIVRAFVNQNGDPQKAAYNMFVRIFGFDPNRYKDEFIQNFQYFFVKPHYDSFNEQQIEEIERIANIEYLSRYMGGNERIDLYSLFQDISRKFDTPIEKMVKIMKINFSNIGKNMADRGHKQWETLLLRLNLDKDVEQQWGRALNKL